MAFTDDELEEALRAATERRSWASPAEVAFHLPGAQTTEVVERLAAVAWADVFTADTGWTEAREVPRARIERVRHRPGESGAARNG